MQIACSIEGPQLAIPTASQVNTHLQDLHVHLHSTGLNYMMFIFFIQTTGMISATTPKAPFTRWKHPWYMEWWCCQALDTEGLFPGLSWTLSIQPLNQRCSSVQIIWCHSMASVPDNWKPSTTHSLQKWEYYYLWSLVWAQKASNEFAPSASGKKCSDHYTP